MPLSSNSIRVCTIRFNLQKTVECLTESSIHDAVNDPIKTCVEVAERRANIYQLGRVRLRVSTRLHDPSDFVRQQRQRVRAYQNGRHAGSLELCPGLLRLHNLAAAGNDSWIADRVDLGGELLGSRSNLGSMLQCNQKHPAVDQNGDQHHGEM